MQETVRQERQRVRKEKETQKEEKGTKTSPKPKPTGQPAVAHFFCIDGTVTLVSPPPLAHEVG